jgi:hypothetical protein
MPAQTSKANLACSKAHPWRPLVVPGSFSGMVEQCQVLQGRGARPPSDFVSWIANRCNPHAQCARADVSSLRMTGVGDSQAPAQRSPWGARFIGGANVPALGLRMNATRPFGRLEVDQSELRLFVVPRWLPAEELEASPASLREVFRVASRLRHGVGFQALDGREWYFWSSRADEILRLLEQLRYPIGQPRSKTKVWKGTP